MPPQIQAFFDPATWTVTYVVHDGAAAAVIDSVLDYDPSRSTSAPASCRCRRRTAAPT
jgi:hypothetical protein